MKTLSELWPYIVSVVAGGGLVRFLTYVAKAIPPLPKDAGWWKQFGYNLIQGVTSIDPNTVSLKPWNGSVERRGQ